MKVSVIIETFNHEKYISECLEGVFNQQTNFDVEIIIANDCSTDNTDLIIKDYLKKKKTPFVVKYFSHEKNKGMIDNFIFTLEECKGEYIAICEGDDYWIDSLKLQKQVDFLDKNKDFSLCFHRTDELKLDGTIVKSNLAFSENEDKTFTIKDLMMGNFIHTPSTVFRNIIKIFPFEFKQTPFPDYFLYMMLAEKGNIKYFKETMAIYRTGVGVFSSNTSLNQTKHNLKSLICLLSYLKDDEIKESVFQRHLVVVAILENKILNQYKGMFISNKNFFKGIKIITDNHKNPLKIFQIIKNKFIRK